METLFDIVFTNLKFIQVNKLANFLYVTGVFLPRKFKLTAENFKLVSQRNKTLSLSDQSLEGDAGGVALESEG